MIFSFKCAKIIHNQFYTINKLCYYFSAGKSTFVKNARALDKLKTSGTFTQTHYEHGKYILLVKHDMVCLEGNDKLLWKDYKGISCLNDEDFKPLTVILDIVTDPNLGDVCLFAVDYDVSEDNVKNFEEKTGGKLINARKSLFTLDEKESQYVTQAKGLTHFCRSTNFCAGCGDSLNYKSAGTHKQCENCKRSYYPQISPVGITLIEDKTHSKVLLVRQSRHPAGMYSCVAGFIEPGESLEMNIKREIAEEVGLDVENVEYCASQHWAMPASQLMLGCIATACGENFETDENEIQDAKWVVAEELKHAVNRIKKSRSLSDVNPNALWVPPPSAVAHQLMSIWLKKYHNYAVPVASHI